MEVGEKGKESKRRGVKNFVYSFYPVYFSFHPPRPRLAEALTEPFFFFFLVPNQSVFADLRFLLFSGTDPKAYENFALRSGEK